MHLAFMIRGHKHWQDRFINELASRYMPYRWFNPKTKLFENKVIEMRLCPIQLFDACFPEPCYDMVANTLFGEGKGKPMVPAMNKVIWAMQKGMKFKPLLDYKQELMLPMEPPQHQEMIAIGVKEDYWVNVKTGKNVYNPTEEEKKDCFEGI
jgi:hypothetical protein